MASPAAAELRGSQGSSTLNCLPASVLKEIRFGKDRGPCRMFRKGKAPQAERGASCQGPGDDRYRVSFWVMKLF